jgi:hypothetical protein
VTDGQFDNHVRQVLETLTAEPRFVLGMADQVPPDGQLHWVARVRDLIERYGYYLGARP